MQHIMNLLCPDNNKLKKNQKLLVGDSARPSNSSSLDALELFLYITGQQPFILGRGYKTQHGKLGYIPLNIKRDDHVIIAKKKNTYSESLLTDIKEYIFETLTEENFNKIMNFLKNRVDNLIVTASTKDVIDEIYELKLKKFDNIENAKKKVIDIFFSDFTDGACEITRILGIVENLDGKTQRFCHPIIGDMFNDLEEMVPYNGEVSHVIILDDVHYTIPMQQMLDMKHPEIECEYYEVAASSQLIECKEEVLLEDLRESGNFRYSVMKVNDDKKRLKLRLIDGANEFDQFIKELHAMFISKCFDEWLKNNKLSLWTERNEQEKLQDVRVLKLDNYELKEKLKEKEDEVKAKQQRIEALERELIEKGLDDLE